MEMKSAKVYDRMKQHSLSTCDASMRCMECNPQYIYIYILCVYTYVVCVCANVYSMYINMSMYPSPLWMWWGVGHTCIHTYMYVCKYIHYIHCSDLSHWDVLLGPIRKSMGASAGDRGNMPFLFRKLDMYHRRAGRVKCFKR